jgi:hypothetical protein
MVSVPAWAPVFLGPASPARNDPPYYRRAWLPGRSRKPAIRKWSSVVMAARIRRSRITTKLVQSVKEKA